MERPRPPTGGRRPGCWVPRPDPNHRASPAATRCDRPPPSSARPTCTQQAGITDPRRQIDTAELYVPFSWHEPIWLEAFGLADEGDGWKLVDDGTTELGGSLPINASGGVLSSNPIGASGLLRFAEAANQVRGAAGEHQVEGAKVAIGMAYGANSQYFSTWAVGSSLQPFG